MAAATGLSVLSLTDDSCQQSDAGDDVHETSLSNGRLDKVDELCLSRSFSHDSAPNAAGLSNGCLNLLTRAAALKRANFQRNTSSDISEDLLSAETGYGSSSPELHQFSRSSTLSQVQKTNDSSILSKQSMISNGYYSDAFTCLFVDRTPRRAPLINRGYYVRAVAVERSVDAFLRHFSKDKKQILVLGAGFDTTYFRLKERGLLNDTSYVELDFEAVVQNKAELIRVTPQLFSTFTSDDGSTLQSNSHSPSVALKSADYTLASVDLRDTAAFTSLCQRLLNPKLPTLVISEVVLTYLSAEHSDAVLKSLNNFLSSVFLVLYEQVHPADEFGSVMIQHFETVGSPLLTIKKYPTLVDLYDRFATVGFTDVVTWSANQVYHEWIDDPAEKERLSLLEPFDEWEAFALKLSHYFIAWGCTGLCRALHRARPSTQQPLCPPLTHTQVLLHCYTFQDNPIHCYGHRSLWLGDGDVAFLGGFGEALNSKKHARLNDITVVNVVSHNVTKFNCLTVRELADRLYFTATEYAPGCFFIFGGRHSPAKVCTDFSTVIFKKKTWESSNSNPCAQSSEKAVQQRHNTMDSHTRPGVPVTCAHRLSRTSWGYNVTSETALLHRQHHPMPRYRHSAALIEFRDIPYVCIFGGRTSQSDARINIHSSESAWQTLNDCHLFNPANKHWSEWRQADRDYPEPRFAHSAAVWGKTRMVISCGMAANERPLRSIHIMDFDNFKWSKHEPNIMPRFGHTSHVVNNKLLLVGGVTLDTYEHPAIAVLDLNTWAVTLIDWLNSPPSPVLFCGHDSFIVNEKQHYKLYLCGGGANCFSFGTLLNRFLCHLQLPHTLLSK